MPEPPSDENPWASPPRVHGDVSRSRRAKVLGLAGGSAVLVALVGGVVALGQGDRTVSSVRAGAVPSSRPSSGAPVPSRVPVSAPTTPEPPAGGAVVDPGSAGRVVREYWSQHEQALRARDLVALSGLAAGPARDWEQGVVGCGCAGASGSAPRPLEGTGLVVPRQTVYPASFVAQVSTVTPDGIGRTEVLVFTKETAGRPWLVVQDGGYVPGSGGPDVPPVPDTDQEGFAVSVTAGATARAATLPAALTGMWQRTRDEGRLPTGSTGFSLAGSTGDRLHRIVAVPQDSVDPDNGLREHFSYTTGADDPVTVVDAGPAVLACGTVIRSVTYTSGRPGGGAVRQDPDRKNWGPRVDPGLYSKLYNVDLRTACFLVPDDPSGPVVVLDDQPYGNVNTTGWPLDEPAAGTGDGHPA